MCDTNQDLKLTFNELEKCLNSEQSNKMGENPMARANPSTIIALMDTNKDGVVSLAEYLVIVDNVGKSKGGNVEITDRFGQKKIVSADERWDKMNTGPQDLKMEKDHMIKEIDGKTTMDKLAKENPQVNNMVTMAKWGLHMLIINDIVSNNTNMLHLRSLPVGGYNPSNDTSTETKLELARENIEMHGRFEVWLELTLEDITGNTVTNGNKKTTQSKSKNKSKSKSKSTSTSKSISTLYYEV